MIGQRLMSRTGLLPGRPSFVRTRDKRRLTSGAHREPYQTFGLET